MIQRVLVTGFEPFGGDATNPSAELALSVDGLVFGAMHVVGRVLPVEYSRSSQLLLEWMAELCPAAIICTGLAATADCIRLERTAVNEDDSAFPDNAGVIRERCAIVPGATRTLHSTLPIATILRRCSEEQLAASESEDAGRYVCNHVFFTLMHALHEKRSAVPAGFIHIPQDLPRSAEVIPIVLGALT